MNFGRSPFCSYVQPLLIDTTSPAVQAHHRVLERTLLYSGISSSSSLNCSQLTFVTGSTCIQLAETGAPHRDIRFLSVRRCLSIQCQPRLGQRIIEHLLPEVVDDVMHVCPCLANDELFHTLSCDCFDFAHWSGGVFTDQTSQIVRLCRPTLFVHRQLHDDTITIMLKLPSTIICCSGACLLAFLSYTPLRYCKSIMRCTIKFSMAKFVSHWRSTNNWSITNDWGITKRNEAFFE